MVPQVICLPMVCRGGGGGGHTCAFGCAMYMEGQELLVCVENCMMSAGCAGRGSSNVVTVSDYERLRD